MELGAFMHVHLGRAGPRLVFDVEEQAFGHACHDLGQCSEVRSAIWSRRFSMADRQDIVVDRAAPRAKPSWANDELFAYTTPIWPYE
jgi:hypothetical protein